LKDTELVLGQQLEITEEVPAGHLIFRSFTISLGSANTGEMEWYF
jgi:hypothetical protein